MDFSEAFDSVHHHLLLFKLEHYSFSGSLLQWFRYYLSTRYQRVILDGCTSDWLPLTSGIPQGSIVGPLLFLLYINDLPNVINSRKIALYADGSKLYSRVSSHTDCQNLQADLHALCKWSSTWQLPFNAKKCKVLTICKRKNPETYDNLLNDTVL